MAAEPIVTVPNPVLVTVKLCVAVVPTATLPKLTLVALGESMPAPAGIGRLRFRRTGVAGAAGEPRNRQDHG